MAWLLLENKDEIKSKFTNIFRAITFAMLSILCTVKIIRSTLSKTKKFTGKKYSIRQEINLFLFKRKQINNKTNKNKFQQKTYKENFHFKTLFSW